MPVQDVLGVRAVERLDDGVADLPGRPAALGQALVLDRGDPAVALFGVVVAGVDDGDTVGGLVHKPVRQVRDRLQGNRHDDDLGVARRVLDLDGVAPVSSASAVRVPGPREFATETSCPRAVSRRVRLPPMLPAPMMPIFMMDRPFRG